MEVFLQIQAGTSSTKKVPYYLTFTVSLNQIEKFMRSVAIAVLCLCRSAEAPRN